MRKLYLHSKEELIELVDWYVSGEKGLLKTWELEVSDCAWPKLHVTYYHMDDGQALHQGLIPLNGPSG